MELTAGVTIASLEFVTLTRSFLVAHHNVRNNFGTSVSKFQWHNDARKLPAQETQKGLEQLGNAPQHKLSKPWEGKCLS